MERGDAPPLLSFRADQPVLLASTAKVVTSLAALDLLGPQHRWRTAAYATAPVSEGRLRGDLVIDGGPVGLTGNELRRWFVQMREEGLLTIFGNIVLDNVALLHERDPKQVKATEEERALDAPIDARTYNQGKLVVSVRPTAGRAGRGEREAAAGQRAGDQRRADGRRLHRLGELEAAGRDRVRPAAAALGARPLEDGLPGARTSPTSGRRRRCASSPSPAPRRRRRFPRRAWSPSSGPRPAAACAAR